MRLLPVYRTDIFFFKLRRVTVWFVSELYDNYTQQKHYRVLEITNLQMVLSLIQEQKDTNICNLY